VADRERRLSVRIALDAMGGDRAPGVIIDGAIAAVREVDGLGIALVGRRDAVEPLLAGRAEPADSIELVEARDVVAMDEQPSATLRKKRDSSIAVGLRMQHEGTAEGFVSAGNTGAVVANALITLGRIRGVKRPAIATVVPNQAGGCIMLDVGANIECSPDHLFQYAVMGACYAERVLEKKNPRVGLLNVGEERTKGTGVVQAAYHLLENGDLNFVGNVEGRDLFAGSVDVAVCDGFVGNILLKFTESVVDMVSVGMRQAMTSSLRGRLGGALLHQAFRHLKRRFDYAEYGGAPLLGLEGVVMIAHGSSSVRAVKNAILATTRYIKYDVGSVIRERLEQRERTPSEDR
jgi:glycerol-3-phosphate acyltransferase PlsX